ncbi:Zinc finger CCHC domain-containing protein 7, partial [Calypte anna]
EDMEAYEDELYHEESSSEQSVDSEVEFHLYSQVHYSQNLGEISTLEVDEEADAAGATCHSSAPAEQQSRDKEISGFRAQRSDDPEVIVLSDSPDEDSVYKSKAKKPSSSSAQCLIGAPPGSSTPNHAAAEGGTTLDPGGSRPRKSPGGKLQPAHSARGFSIQDVLVIDDSSEEESLMSEGDDVESWMLLGAGVDDRDEDIMLNLEGCA